MFDFAEDASDNPTFYADLHEPQSLNKYQYTFNNPLRYVDPNGHQIIVTPRDFLRAIAAARSALKSIGEFREKVRRRLGTDRESTVRYFMDRGSTRAEAERHADAVETLNNSVPMVGGITKVSSLAKAFGFREGSLQVEGMVAGELKGGGTVSVAFAKTGEQLSINVSNVAGHVAGTLKEIELGAMNAAKEAGASTVRVVATNVNDRVVPLLVRKGFTEIMKDGKGTGSYERIIQVE